jgi:hypothetical protein
MEPAERRVAARAAALLLLPAVAVGGCSGHGEHLRGSDSPLPQERLRAVTHQSGADSADEIRALIEALESDDAAIRAAAIDELERLTGERRGYEPLGPLARRGAAVRRWVQWYNARFPGPERAGTGDAAGGE